jgi:hypothetical protein
MIALCLLAAKIAIDSVTAGVTPRTRLCKELFLDLLESVIPECFYRESRRDQNWTPD